MRNRSASARLIMWPVRPRLQTRHAPARQTNARVVRQEPADNFFEVPRGEQMDGVRTRPAIEASAARVSRLVSARTRRLSADPMGEPGPLPWPCRSRLRPARAGSLVDCLHQAPGTPIGTYRAERPRDAPSASISSSSSSGLGRERRVRAARPDAYADRPILTVAGHDLIRLNNPTSELNRRGVI